MHGDKPQNYLQNGWLDTNKEERTQKLQEQTFLKVLNCHAAGLHINCTEMKHAVINTIYSLSGSQQGQISHLSANILFFKKYVQVC